jgi:hypothetical protein
MGKVLLKSTEGVIREFETQHALRILKAQETIKKVAWKVESPEYEYKDGDLSKKKPVKIKE